MIYTHAAAAIGGAVLAGALAWNVQGWRLGEEINGIKAQHAEVVAASAKSALRLTEIYRENADAALRKAEARSAQNKRDADSLHSELDRLRGDLATVPGRIRNATREAVDQYAAAASVVFDQCVRRYSEVAGAAQGHSADVQTLMDAWPSQPR
jgi:Tfp pilus assembly protein PilX